MANENFAWMYLLIFMIIPLARIIPRLLKRGRMKNHISPQTLHGEKFEHGMDNTVQKHTRDPSRPQTKDMLVLGELNNGTKTFENIKKNTDLDNNELNSILENLEERGLLRVEQKQGLFGTKVELYSTEKGFKEYYS